VFLLLAAQTPRAHVLENVKRNFAEVSLELGGKSPFIVFDDANMRVLLMPRLLVFLGQLDKAVSLVRACTCIKILQMSFLKR
jgi:hypothetical protein